MKKNIILACMFLTFGAFANCPNITGSYTCTSAVDGSVYTSTYVQSVQNGSPVLTEVEEGLTIVLNNQWQTITIEGDSAEVKAYCDSNIINTEILGTFDGFNVQVLGKIELNQNTLMITDKLILNGHDYGDTIEYCVRN